MKKKKTDPPEINIYPIKKQRFLKFWIPEKILYLLKKKIENFEKKFLFF